MFVSQHAPEYVPIPADCAKLVDGVMTMVLAIAGLVILPDFPSKPKSAPLVLGLHSGTPLGI